MDGGECDVRNSRLKKISAHVGAIVAPVALELAHEAMERRDGALRNTLLPTSRITAQQAVERMRMRESAVGGQGSGARGGATPSPEGWMRPCQR